ncbi:MAG TPA: hypothetical protein VFN35_35305, partial [Ktedonobacteraceae bacterium]|nr:hypothetical protein [Ktedonobacteraceae bacterium]
MDIDSLRSSLQGCMQTVGQQKQLIVSQAVFNDIRINRLIDMCFDGTVITINNALIDESNTNTSQIIITGKGTLFQVVDMPVEATFWPSDDGVECVLRYFLPVTWKFSQSFPTLPATWMPSSAQLSSSDLSCSILDLLAFTDASFILSTLACTNSFYDIQISTGINFAGHLRMNGLLGLIEQALAFPEPFTLAGPIILPNASSAIDPLTPLSWPPRRLDSPFPGINLKADIGVNLSLGAAELQDTYLVFYSPMEEVRSGISYSPGLFLGGLLQIGEHFSVEVIAKKMLGDDNEFVLSGMFDGLALPNLSQFAELMGGDDLLSSLIPPDSLPSFLEEGTLLSINAISLTINCSPFSISSIYLVVGLGDALWHPLDGIEVEGLTVYFMVYNPLSTQRSLQAVISGTLSMGDLALNMSASIPTFTIKALLPQDSDISLKTLLAPYVPDIPEVGDLIVNALYLEVQPGQSFTITTAMADSPQPWSIEIGPETLTLSNMQILLTYARNAGLSGSLRSSLTLAGAQLDVAYQFPGPLMLRGQLPTLSLKTLLTRICGDDLDWPANFDIDLEQSYVLFER